MKHNIMRLVDQSHTAYGISSNLEVKEIKAEHITFCADNPAVARRICLSYGPDILKAIRSSYPHIAYIRIVPVVHIMPQKKQGAQLKLEFGI